MAAAFQPHVRRAQAGAAPLSVDADSLSDDELSMGYKAACTPGNLGGYLALIERFGTTSLAETLKYAIEYAEGHPVSEALASAIAAQAEVLGRWPTSAALFLPDVRPNHLCLRLCSQADDGIVRRAGRRWLARLGATRAWPTP